MKVQGVDHIAIAVANLEDAIPLYRDVLGMTLQEIEEVPDQKVKTAIFVTGSQRVELLQPTSDDSPISKFLQKRGPGLHHIAMGVDDIEAAIQACQEKGLTMIDEQPKIGAGGCKIAFVHPKSAGGILLELTQRQ